jgi:hypothetical protein
LEKLSALESYALHVAKKRKVLLQNQKWMIMLVEAAWNLA